VGGKPSFSFLVSLSSNSQSSQKETRLWLCESLSTLLLLGEMAQWKEERLEISHFPSPEETQEREEVAD